MTKTNRPIIIWLFTGCLLIFLMVVIGGITRLTHSGLSMTEWKLISGSKYPTNEAQWQEKFEQYKQFPEYKKVNKHFTVQDFKKIFFWEYLHRMIGRLIGVVFIIPFFYFLIRNKLDAALIKKTLILLAMGALQGFLGWYMVQSGLMERPDVSHYRLAFHLIMAFITFSYTFWVMLGLIYPKKNNTVKKLKKPLYLLLILVLIQIIYGAFVAGLDAGFIHNHWPKMNGGLWMPDTVTYMKPWHLNYLENPSGVQFVHRTLALIILTLVAYIWFETRKIHCTISQNSAINSLLILILTQVILGIYTLLNHVPVVLGALHQITAFFLLSAVVYTLHRFTAKRV
jgi:cytochrome c oxidase assembly protein subunit 15